MTETKDDATWAESLNISKATDDDLRRLKKMTDDDLLRSSRTLDCFAITESMRRLKEALHKEERAIKWLTFWLVILTVILVILTIILVFLGVEALWRR